MTKTCMLKGGRVRRRNGRFVAVHIPEQTASKAVRTQERNQLIALLEGIPKEQICKQLNVSPATVDRIWRHKNRYGEFSSY